jgi:hypothetical protein
LELGLVRRQNGGCPLQNSEAGSREAAQSRHLRSSESPPGGEPAQQAAEVLAGSASTAAQPLRPSRRAHPLADQLHHPLELGFAHDFGTVRIGTDEARLERHQVGELEKQ